MPGSRAYLGGVSRPERHDVSSHDVSGRNISGRDLAHDDWPMRRLIVPLTMFIEKPFQNCARDATNHIRPRCPARAPRAFAPTPL
jgi:hypothetical protein